MLLYLAGLGDVLGALESHCLEGYEPICIPEVLPDSHEFHGQRLYESAPDLPTWQVVLPIGHHRQRFPSVLPFLVGLDPPLRFSPLLECTQSQ